MAEVEQVAVIGDVHADWPALSVVAEQIAAAGIDRVICLGDCGVRRPGSRPLL